VSGSYDQDVRVCRWVWYQAEADLCHRSGT
jgi:hypothetical protein